MKNEQTNSPGALLNGVPAYVHAENLGDEDTSYGMARYVRDGWIPKAQKAALQEGTTTEGGFLVADDELKEIVAKRDETSIPRLMGARTFSTNLNKFNIPREDGSLARFTIVAEEGAISIAEEEPTFSQLGISIYKMMKLIKVSEEILEDENSGLQNFLIEAIGRAVANTENYYSLIGTGSGEPQGILVGGQKGVDFAVNNTIAVSEVVKVKYTLAQPYRDDNACWVLNDKTEGYLRGITGSPFLFSPTPKGTGERGMETLEGYPVFSSRFFPEIGSQAKSLAFTNWFYYALVTNRSMRLRKLTELYADQGQIALLATIRWGGAVILPEAFKYGQHPT